MNDSKLIKQIKRGNAKAVERAIEEYGGYVYTIVKNILGCSMQQEDIEETVADVFIKLWKHSENIDESRPLKPYLIGIARNAAKNKLKLRFRRTAIVLASLLILSLGTVTANAMTNGAVFHSIKAWIIDEDGTKRPLDGSVTFVDEDGNTVTSFKGIGTLTQSADGSSAVFAVNDEVARNNSSTNGSITISGDEDGIDEVVFGNAKVPEFVKKFENADPGTYDYTDKDGKVYTVIVDENGDISATTKEE